MVAPISGLGPVAQVFVWYVASLLMGFGCVVEGRRLWTLIRAGDDRVPTAWIVSCAVLAVALPTFECLQRGQMGVALLYAILLGYRLVLDRPDRLGLILGGIALAWGGDGQTGPPCRSSSSWSRRVGSPSDPGGRNRTVLAPWSSGCR